jgi:hypothetical protein
MVIKLTVEITEAYHWSISYIILSNIPLSSLHMQMKLFGITNVDSDVTDQQLIKFSISGRNWKKEKEYNGTIHQLFLDFKKSYDSISKEVLYNVLIAFEILRKLAGLIKICSNET